MSALADAAKWPVFSNGTEGHAWMSNWCSYCVHDHGMHQGNDNTDEACDLILLALLENSSNKPTWPEAWLPEPDDGKFFMPSRLTCLKFEPCNRGLNEGSPWEPCDGDPHAEVRAEQVAEVIAYWKEPAK